MTNTAFNKTEFEQDLALIIKVVDKFKQTYPSCWQEVCQQALDEGELTLSDALSGLTTAQMILEGKL